MLLEPVCFECHFQTKAGKCVWALVVVAGFATASYLIIHSYLAWQQSPISTSITTRPIDTLKFPMVTVCPPKGSNTALNYDIIRADNHSLTEQDRETLKREIHEIFLQSSHQSHVNTMIGMINPENLKMSYDRTKDGCCEGVP